MAKRIFDVIVSLFSILILLPVMAIIAVAVRRSSPGPALFVQPRVGKGEQSFNCYKFRTMAIGAPVAGSHDVSESWITPTGRWLRSTKLDELPQLFNVLRGDIESRRPASLSSEPGGGSPGAAGTERVHCSARYYRAGATEFYRYVFSGYACESGRRVYQQPKLLFGSKDYSCNYSG